MELNKRSIKILLFIIGCTVLMVFCAVNISAIAKLVLKVIDVFSPFLLGLCFAFLLNLLLCPIEKLWKRIFKKQNRFTLKAKRPLSIFLSLLVVSAAIFLILFIIIPQISDTFSLLTVMLPKAFGKIEDGWASFLSVFKKLTLNIPDFGFNQKEILKKFSGMLSDGSGSFFNKTIDTTASVISSVAKVGVGLIFSVYVLSSKEKLGAQLRKLTIAVMPKGKAEKLFFFVSDVNRTFTKFVTGQLTEAVILGMLCLIGMLILRMPYAPAISLLIGVTALIPMFGAFIGIILGALFILAVNPLKALWFVIFIVILQQFEGNVIYPRVVGKSVGLPGIWVLTAVAVGGSLCGIVGMLLSVPVGSLIYFAIARFVTGRLKTKSKAAENAQP